MLMATSTDDSWHDSAKGATMLCGLFVPIFFLLLKHVFKVSLNRRMLIILLCSFGFGYFVVYAHRYDSSPEGTYKRYFALPLDKVTKIAKEGSISMEGGDILLSFDVEPAAFDQLLKLGKFNKMGLNSKHILEGELLTYEKIKQMGVELAEIYLDYYRSNSESSFYMIVTNKERSKVIFWHSHS